VRIDTTWGGLCINIVPRPRQLGRLGQVHDGRGDCGGHSFAA
jgi:hypothetical protein